jgi:hypothetical protein
MTTDYTRAFEIPKEGLQIEGGPLIIGGDSDPTGIDLPVGTRYYRSNGDEYRKTGASANDWTLMTYEASVNPVKTGFDNQTDSTISFDDATRTLTISPSVTSFDVWVKGSKYTKTSSENIQIDDLEGIHYIYYDDSGYMTKAQAVWDLKEHAPVSIIYWDSTNKKAILFGEERHTHVMDYATHFNLHFTERTKIELYKFLLKDYVLMGDGSSDAHAKVGMTSGRVFDEDITMTVVDTPTPSNQFEQTLTPNIKIPLWYRDGADGDWREVAADDYPCLDDTGNTIKYNKYNETTEEWELVNASEGYFVVTWVFATNNVNAPIIGVVGQKQNETLIESAIVAGFEKLTDIVDGLPFVEFYPLYKLIFRTKSTYTNTPKAALNALIEIKYVEKENDRQPFICSYGGNANTGTYLEFFPNVGSDEAPLPIHDNTYVRKMSVYSPSNVTCDISFYEIGNLTTPRYTVVMTNENYKVVNLSEWWEEGEKMVCKVSDGSILKPSILIQNQAQVG